MKLNLFKDWWRLVQIEFDGYSPAIFQKDLLAGLTVAAVALPLALAYGVAAGVDAAAGLITSIVAGILVAVLGGASFSVSGPTGGLAAVLVVFTVQFGVQGALMIGLLAGIILILLAVFRMGKIVTLMPAPVIAGYTSGVAIIIAVGQIDNALGIKTAAADTILQKIIGYFQADFSVNLAAIGLTLIVIGLMSVWPRLAIAKQIPGSLAAIIVATLVFILLGWDAPVIGNIPRSIMLPDRLNMADVAWSDLGRYLVPAVAVAALVSIESLLCGALAENTTGRRPNNEVELAAQGIANLIVPFFGGIAASSALSRTAVNLRSGSVTRLSPLIHGLVLLLVVFVLAPIIGRVPLSALAGVLIMTAWRMNQWGRMRFYADSRLKHALIPFLATVLATVLLNLTQAILIGLVLSIVIFVAQTGRFQSLWQAVAVSKTSADEHRYTVAGPIFFGSVRRLCEQVEAQSSADEHVILHMADAPLIDATGIEGIKDLHRRQQSGGGSLSIADPHPQVAATLGRCNLLDEFSR